MPFESMLTDYDERRAMALGMGGSQKLDKRRNEGVLNARERLDYLLDRDSFFESGLFAKGIRPEVKDKSAADAKIAGFGLIEGRPVAVVSNDFTVLGASSSAINGKKVRHVKEVSIRNGMPLVFLGESSGARMPDRMGAAGRAMLGQDPFEYRRLRETPWVSALLGNCYGSSTWYGCLSDFAVMRKGATMAVASSRVTSIAIHQPVDPEELGGWKLHTGTTGLVDLAVDSDEAALEAVKRFLSYLPSHSGEAPPRTSVPDHSNDVIADVLSILPEARSKVYDMRRIIEVIADHDSMFELKSRFGKSVVTVLARLDGHSVGVIANNPMFKGGAIDVDACNKVISFLILCDSYNIPIIFLVDQPGFLIGLEGERRAAPGRIMNWMSALSLVTVPKVSIILRKSYGQAYLNMGGGRNSDEVACWPTADLGFMDPVLAVNVLYGVKPDEEPERFQKLVQDVSRDSSAWSLAELYESHAVLDPRQSRDWLTRILEFHRQGPNKAVGEHHLRSWPTTF